MARFFWTGLLIRRAVWLPGSGCGDSPPADERVAAGRVSHANQNLPQPDLSPPKP